MTTLQIMGCIGFIIVLVAWPLYSMIRVKGEQERQMEEEFDARWEGDDEV